MKRLLVNDTLTAIEGTRTFWHDLQDWFNLEFTTPDAVTDADLIIRNATYFPPFPVKARTISLVQDIIADGPARQQQLDVIASSAMTVFNSEFTLKQYVRSIGDAKHTKIPLPVNFDIFSIGNPMGLQQALSLPDNCVCWIGACQQAGWIKGFDIFLNMVRTNPDVHFVAVFKDEPPAYVPPNMRVYSRLSQEELSQVMGACRVGLCTSRMESQHLSGIEMGACGLPMVAPGNGIYHARTDLPGVIAELSAPVLMKAVRGMLDNPGDRVQIRNYWESRFNKDIIKRAWSEVISEVECSGAS